MENEQPKKHINWTYIIIAGFVVLGLISWGYIGSIKEKNRIEQQKIDVQAQLEREKMRAEQADKDAKMEAENERQLNIDLCLSAAQTNYSNNWDGSCSSLAEKQETNYKSCVSSYMETGYYTNTEATSACRRTWPKLKTADCSLPTATASRWDESKKEEEEACYKRYQ